MERLERRHARTVFSLPDIVNEVTAATSRYPVTTIRTHIISYLTSGTYGPYGSSYPVLERVSRGHYRRRTVPVLVDSTPTRSASPITLAGNGLHVPGMGFEKFARAVLSDLWQVELKAQTVELQGGVTHSFDFVAPDHTIIGDAKCSKDLEPMPAATLAAISEYVWLLQQHPTAHRRLLVFGDDPALPGRWIERYAPLLNGVEMWFLTRSHLERLA
jgi:hypothetical protein